MKIFLAILPIALMVQVSLAASAGRVKRNDIVEEAATDMLKIARHITALSETLSHELIKAMPKTEEYSKLRQDLDDYLKDVNEFNTQSGNCILKTIKVLNSLESLYEKYEESDEDSSEEMKELDEILKKNGGDQLKKEIEDFKKKYNTEDFKKKLESFDEDSADKWNIANEVC